MATINRNGNTMSIGAMRQYLKDFGSSLDFSSGGIVKFGTGNPFGDTVNGFYVSMWVKWFGPNSDYQHLMSKRDLYGPTTMMFDLYIDSVTGKLSLDTGNGQADGGVNLPLERWCHVLYSHSPSPVLKEQFYVDSVRVSNAPTTGQGTGTTALLSIGACEAAAIEPFNGLIDEVVVGVYAPSWKEVVAMNKKFGYKNVYAYFNFDELSGSTAIDLSGNNHTGTITTATYSTDVAMKARN